MAEAEARLRALMHASLAGDAGAYAVLLEELSVSLRAYYRHRLPPGYMHIEDLVQEALITVDRRRASYDAAQPFTPWVFAIARYRLVDHLRRERVRVTQSLDGLEDLFGVDVHEQAAMQIDADRALSMLPDKQRNAIRMTRIEGHSIDETAHATGQSPSAVKVAVHRGLKRLRALLGRP